MRLAVYGSVSSILAIGVVLSAMHQRSNFYAACIYLSKSSACMMILLNMGFIISLLFGKLLQAIFFGRLRAIEVEHLYERSWYAVTETCLAMTIFREEFDLQFIVVFTTLLFLKIFHWLCQDRVEYMEQSPANRHLFHIRITNLMGLLLLVDMLLAQHAIKITLQKGPNMMIMFGFEYTILIFTILSTTGKYLLNVIDMSSEQTWEGKSMYVFYLDLVTDFFKLVTYLVFFLYICLNYQLPLHIIRDVYVTFRSFIQKCRDLYRYRRATRNMNELYPNATAEDLNGSSDSTCIICREEMQVTVTAAASPVVEEENQEPAAYRNDSSSEQNLDQPKKLPCGHIFHFHCLRSWLERQQTCPTCRRSVLVDANNNNNTTTPAAAANNNAPPLFGAANQPQQQAQQQQGMQGQNPFHQFGQFGNQPFQAHIQQQQLHQQQQPQQPQHNYITRAANATPLNILTPSNESTNHVPIPGLIPLVPLNLHSANLCTPQMRERLPTTLSEQDLQILSTITREGMEQRLKVLEAVQNQILQSMETLTQVLSVLPNTDPLPFPTTRSSAFGTTTNEGCETQAQSSSGEQSATTQTETRQNQASSSSSSSTSPTTATSTRRDTSTTLIEVNDDENEEDSGLNMSSRRKGKMPDRTTVFTDDEQNNRQNDSSLI